MQKFTLININLKKLHHIFVKFNTNLFKTLKQLMFTFIKIIKVQSAFQKCLLVYLKI